MNEEDELVTMSSRLIRWGCGTIIICFLIMGGCTVSVFKSKEKTKDVLINIERGE